MCNLSKGVEEKGMAKGMARGMAQGMEKGMAQGMAKGMARGMAQGMTRGRTDGILSSIKGLMETMNLSIEQSMAALKIPEAERQKYRDLLEKQ